jgi:hypothetical protein
MGKGEYIECLFHPSFKIDGLFSYILCLGIDIDIFFFFMHI